MGFSLLVSLKYSHFFNFCIAFSLFWWHENTQRYRARFGVVLMVDFCWSKWTGSCSSRLSRVNWMTDELLSHWWATFTVNPGFEWDLQCLHTSLVCFFVSLSHPFFTHLSPHVVFPPSLRPDTFYFSLSYLCLHLASFLWNLSVFSQMVLSTPLLYIRLSIALFPAISPPFSFRLVSSCLILSWCFSFRQLMENKITTIERGAFQDLKELERLWVQFFLSSNQVFTQIKIERGKMW